MTSNFTTGLFSAIYNLLAKVKLTIDILTGSGALDA